MSTIQKLLAMALLLSSCASKSNIHITRSNRQSDPVVYGTLYENDANKPPLQAGAVIADERRPYHSIDRAGKFRFNIPPGKHIFRATWVGYIPQTTKKIMLHPGDSVMVVFYLKTNKKPIAD